jgi:hypothetical protein
MRELQFSFYICGLSDDTFSEQIMIFKPRNSIVKNFTEAILCQSGIVYVSDLIDHLQKDIAIVEGLEALGWGLENFAVETVYIHHRGYLLGLREDKTISEIFQDLETNRLAFAYFLVAGGSIHDEYGYRYTIHSNERIHEHMPHVHVSKSGVEIRYSLVTLSPIDPLVNPHKRDYRKRIRPSLQEKKEKLMELWDFYMKGYTTPEITEDGLQYYSES